MAKNKTSLLLVLTIFLLIFATSSLFAGDWQAEDVTVSGILYGVHFVDENNGWIVGENNVIIHTSDGKQWQGQNWSTSDMPYTLYDVYFVDAQNGWAVGGIAAAAKNYRTIKPNRQEANNPDTPYVIIHTENGGMTWTVQEGPMKDSFLYGVCFVDSNNGWAVGGAAWGFGEAVILHTSDGGNNWTEQNIPIGAGETLYSVHFADAQKGCAVGGATDNSGVHHFYILNTEDGGANWDIVLVDYGRILYDVYFPDDQNGWAVGAGGGTGGWYQPVICSTTDGGQNWIYQVSESNFSVGLNGVHFVTPQEGWTVGLIENQGVVYHTQDGGNNWEPETVSESGTLFDIHDAGKTNLWAVGQSGSMLKKELLAPASVTSIEPDNGKLAGGTSVTITGSMFEQGAAVTIGGAEVPDVKVQSATTIIATTPPGKAGAADVVITNPGGVSATGKGLYTYNPMPTVTGIEPTSGPLTGGNQVTITGTGFLHGATVTIGGKPATDVQVISPTTIKVTVPSATANISVVASGAVDVVVTNPDTQAAKGENIYTYASPLSVTSIEPDNGKLAGGNSVTITGSMFEQGAGVTIGGAKAPDVKVQSATTITATTPPGEAGAADVVVTNPGGVSATGKGLYTYNPMPTVTGIEPTSGPLTGGNQVTITGTGFLHGATVTIGGKPATDVQVISPTTIKVTVPSATANISVVASGAVDVVVTNPDTQAAKGENIYTYIPPPTIASVTPDSGPVAGGNVITIAGKDFVQGMTITIGGKPAELMTFSATEVTVKVPAGALGAKDVILTNPDGQKYTGTYTYRSRTLTLSRTEGFVGDIVKASGSGYAESSVIGKLIFDGSVIADFTDAGAGSVIDGQINSDATGAFEVTFAIPKHIGGAFMVEVDGVQANLRIKARIVISPEKGAAETEITISGDGFTLEKITLDFGETKEITSSDANADGSFTATFNADEQALGVKKIKATGTQSGQSASADFELTESVQVISPTLSSLTTTTPKVEANGFSEAIITITIRDEKGKPVKGARVTIFVTGSDYSFEQPKRTDANGVTTVEITSTTSERKMVTAVAEGVDISDSVKIRFTPGEPSRLTLEANRDKIQADGESTITVKITVFDKHNNPVSSTENPLAIKTVDVEIEPVAGKVETPAKDNGDGTYNSTYTAGDKPGDITITAWTSNGKSGETTISLTGVDRTAEITDVIVAGSPAKAGEKISVTLKGEAGGEATFAIENVAENIPLPEGEAGVYTAEYTVKEGDNVEDAVVTVTLKDALNNEDSDSSSKVTLDTTPPPAPTDLTSPRLIDANNQKSLLISGRATPKKKITVKLTDENKKEVLGNGEAGDGGKFEVEVDAAALSDGIIHITAREEPDAAGNIGMVTEITATKDTTTKPDFVIKTIESQKTARVGSTAVYIITVTGVNNFQQPVTLMSMPPKGLSFEFSQNNLTPSPADPMLYTQLTVTVGSEAKEDTYDIEVWGHSEGYPSKKVNLTLTVERVKLKPILTISKIEQKVTPLGEKVSISGSLVAQEGTLPANANLTASYQKPSGKTVEQSQKTDEDNNYVFEYAPDEVGEWQVTIRWEGNDDFEAVGMSGAFEVTKGNSAIQFDIDDKLSLGAKLTIIAHLNPALPDETINLRVITPPPDNITFASESLKTNEYGRFEWSFTPPEEGDWTLKATYAGNDTYEPVEQVFTLHVIGKQAKAIVVLGGGDKIENPDWKMFNAVAEYVYKILLKRKLKPDDIYFLSTEKEITEGCDDRTSFELLESAITNWAKGQVDEHTPLYIYLLSHNRDDKFLLDIQAGQNIILTAEQLDKWLDELPEGTKVNIIIEACYSGNFIETLAARNRAIMASAVDTEKAYLLPNKSSFSKYFFDFIYRNREIRAAFAETIDLMKNIPIHASQNPQLDADWDGIPNEQDDFDEMAGVYLPKNTPSLADEIEIIDVTPAQTLPQGSTTTTIQAKVRYASDETQVTAAIFPPKFDPEKDEPIIAPLMPVGGELYEFTYQDFNKTGKYVIQIHADNPEESAIPQATAVTIPSPLTARPCDVNNDNVVDISDLVLVGKNFGTSSKTGDVNDDGWVNISDLVLVGKHFGAKW